MTRLYYETPAGVQGLRPVLAALASPDVDADHLDAALRAPLVVTDETVYARNVNGWCHRLTDPREVLEVLSERGLWPWAPGDVDAPRWWCDDHDPRDEDHDVPPSLAALVAVASLGVARLRQVDDCVARLHAITRGRCLACAGQGVVPPWKVVGEAGAAPDQVCGACNGERAVAGVGRQIVWRVMTAEQLREHHGSAAMTSVGPRTQRGIVACGLFSTEASDEVLPVWEETCWSDDPRDRAVWPMLRALALDCGVHLIEATPERCVIGVPHHPQ